MNTRGERSRTMNSDLTFITNEKSIRHPRGVLGEN